MVSFWELSHSIVKTKNGFSLPSLPVRVHDTNEPTLTNLWNQHKVLLRRDNFIFLADYQNNVF
jgi:hypothetical protein